MSNHSNSSDTPAGNVLTFAEIAKAGCDSCTNGEALIVFCRRGTTASALKRHLRTTAGLNVAVLGGRNLCDFDRERLMDKLQDGSLDVLVVVNIFTGWSAPSRVSRVVFAELIPDERQVAQALHRVRAAPYGGRLTFADA